MLQRLRQYVQHVRLSIVQKFRNRRPPKIIEKEKTGTWYQIREAALRHVESREVADKTVRKSMTMIDSKYLQAGIKGPTLFVNSPLALYILNPSSRYKISWDVFVAILIVYSVLIIPYRLGFDLPDPQGFEDILDIIVDCMFTVDIIVCFNTAVTMENRRLLISRKEIAISYLRYWFFIDFFSTIPFDRFSKLFIDDVENDSGDSALRSIKIIKSLRLIRLIKLARVLKLKKLKSHVDNLNINPGLLSMLTLFMKIVFFSHMICCVWQYIGLMNSSELGKSWIISFGVQDQDMEGSYVASMYWVIATLMSVGYGDVVAVVENERIFSILTEIIGAGLFGVILVTVSKFAEGDPMQSELSRKRFELKSYMAHNHLSRSLRRKVLEFYDGYWTLKTATDENEIFSQLSEPLRIRLTLHSYNQVVQNFPMITKLSQMNPSFLADAIQGIVPRYIIYSGAKGSEGWYFLQRGVVEISIQHDNKLYDRIASTGEFKQMSHAIDDDDIVLGIHSPSSHFGQECLGRRFCDNSYQQNHNTSKNTKSNREKKVEPTSQVDSVDDKITNSLHLDVSAGNDRRFPWSQTATRATTAVDCLLFPLKDLEPILYLYPDVEEVVIYNTLSTFKEMGKVYSKVLNTTKTSNSNTSDIRSSLPIFHNSKIVPSSSVASLYSLQRSSEVRKLNTNTIHECLDSIEKFSFSKSCSSKCFRWRKVTSNKVKPLEANLNLDEEENIEEIYIKSGVFDLNKYKYTNETKATMLQKWIILPEWGPKIRWDALVALFIIYSVIFICYRIAFDDPTEWWSFFHLLDLLVDVTFVIDILFSFRTAYFSQADRVFIIAPNLIAKQYLKTWFIIDFLSVVPISAITNELMKQSEDLNESGGELKATKLIRIVRLVRLVKLVRLMKLGKLADSMEEILQSPALLNFLKLLFQVTFVGHILACFWFYVGTGGNTAEQAPNHNTWYKTLLLTNSSKQDQYVASIYWAFTTMTTVGYGDITPVTTGERWYAMMCMMIGASMFGYVVSSVAALSGTFDVGATRAKNKTESLKSFLRQKQVPFKIKRKIEAYNTLLMQHHSPFDEKVILVGLPRQLRFDIFINIHGDAVNRLHFFRNKPIDSALQIVTNMRPQIHKAGDVIYSTTTQGLDVFWILSGVVKIFVTDENYENRRNQKHQKLNRAIKKAKALRMMLDAAPNVLDKANKINPIENIIIRPDQDNGSSSSVEDSIEDTERINALYGNLTQTLKSGMHFGSRFILDKNCCDETAIAQSDVKLLVLTKKEMGKMISEDIEIASILQSLICSDDFRYMSELKGSKFDESEFVQRHKDVNNLILRMSPANRQISVQEELRTRSQKVLVANTMTEGIKLRKSINSYKNGTLNISSTEDKSAEGEPPKITNL